MAGAEAASRVGAPGRHSIICVLSFPCFNNLQNIFTITLKISVKETDKNLCLHTVGTIHVKRISEFYSKLDGDKGSRRKEHTGRPQVALEMCIHAQMCVGVSKLYVGRTGRVQSGRKQHSGKSCLGRGQRAQLSLKGSGLNLGSVNRAVSPMCPGCCAEEARGGRK